MGILALAADERVAGVEINEDELSVRLMDGRTISVPLAWYPRLSSATEAQRNNWRIVGGGYGIHWEDLDEDLSTEGLLRGAPAPRPSFSRSLSKQHVERTRIDDENGKGRSFFGIQADTSERGYSDYISQGKEAEEELVAILSWIGTEMDSLSSKINQHTSQMKELRVAPESATTNEYKKIASLAASDMNTFSQAVETVLSNFQKSLQVLDESFSTYVSLAKPESPADVIRIIDSRNALSLTLSDVTRLKEVVVGFRSTTLLMEKRKFDAKLSKAANRQSKALGEMIINLEQVESFALRILALIDEKFVSPSAAEDASE